MSRLYIAEERDAVRTAIRRGTIEKIDDSGSQQIVRLARGGASEQFEDIYRPQPHGFSSHPPAGSEFLVHAFGGRSDRLYALGGEHEKHRHRNLPAGATALYNASGAIVTLIQNDIRVKSSGTITLEAEEIKLVGTCRLGTAAANKRAEHSGSSTLANKVFVE